MRGGHLKHLPILQASSMMPGMQNQFIPNHIGVKFSVHEWHNGLAVLTAAHPGEWQEILDLLGGFQLRASDILTPGGGKSRIAIALDKPLIKNGWREKKFATKIIVDDTVHETPTHKIDCYKNRIALEVEWNNKDPFFDRDLNNFRLLFDLRAIDAGVIITRSSELQLIFAELGKGSSYGNSTTHLQKLLPRIDGGGGGGCPIVVFAIKPEAYIDDR